MNDGLFQPSDTSRSLPIALLRLREQLMSSFRPMLHRHGITEQQWRVIRILAEAKEIEVTALAGRSFILGPSLSRILRALEAQGYIVKRRDSDDGRKFWMSLSPAGHALITQVQPDSEVIYKELEKRIGKDEIDALLDTLAAISHRLSKD